MNAAYNGEDASTWLMPAIVAAVVAVTTTALLVRPHQKGAHKRPFAYGSSCGATYLFEEGLASAQKRTKRAAGNVVPGKQQQAGVQPRLAPSEAVRPVVQRRLIAAQNNKKMATQQKKKAGAPAAKAPRPQQ